LLSLADFRAPTFSLSVTRVDVGLDGGFELFMQLLGTYFNWLRCSCWNARPDLTSIGYMHSPVTCKTPQRVHDILYSMLGNEYRRICRSIATEVHIRRVRRPEASSKDVKQGTEHLVRGTNNGSTRLGQQKGLT
jgi:hypothetical protein